MSRELREAVASRHVDAQENPLSNTVTFGRHQYHPHVSLTGQLFSFVLFTCNATSFRALPGTLREAVLAAADAASAEQRRGAAHTPPWKFALPPFKSAELADLGL